MDQADRLRDLVSRGENRARVLAVTSGKGGAGKTSLAINLALALVEHGKRVILVDVDIGLANADVLLAVQPRVHLGHVLSGEIGILDALTLTPGGVSLLPGCPGVRSFSDLQDSEREFLLDGFREMERYSDFLVIDTGAGITRNVVRFSAAADEVMVVTTPEPTAITDSYAAIKAISREKGAGRVRLVVNMASSRREAARVGDRICSVARKFLGMEVEVLGCILDDDAVRMAVRRRFPLLLEYPKSRAANCIRDLAGEILADRAVPRSRGFFKRFASAIHGA